MNQANLIVARIERALTKEQASDLAETRRRMAEDYGPASHAGPFRF